MCVCVCVCRYPGRSSVKRAQLIPGLFLLKVQRHLNNHLGNSSSTGRKNVVKVNVKSCNLQQHVCSEGKVLRSSCQPLLLHHGGLKKHSSDRERRRRTALREDCLLMNNTLFIFSCALEVLSLPLFVPRYFSTHLCQGCAAASFGLS